ncbi:TetR/AcrR family transcriptional regulator [Antrihabitans cavernicola]|uniref:TetR family transcriptional regulator n=1 Tax=Antrihabitans cavernicola TaxID=2495913 RepID=A0A5A7S966_9NOCA|nr:TetR/AcrR family transcriptional regulator [Spelaeibacter cavernicola]KAA0021692.1 TetR family transcriptional regulator [Spelaeibacter cavernicola]
MRPENMTDGQKGSFIEEARRRQIIASAVEVIAETGYAGATLARIAKHAGISKGVISYHFDGKDDLMTQLVVQLFVSGAEYMGPLIAQAEGSRNQLMVYIQSNLDFIATNKKYVAALNNVVLNLRVPDGRLKFVAESDEAAIIGPLIDMLERGQKDGSFGDFDARIMAMLIRDAVDGIAHRVSRDLGFDISLYTEQMKRVFDFATRREA